MKIAHVIPALVKGGAEKVVVDLANCAVANGDEVTLILAHSSPPELLGRELRSEVQILQISDRQLGPLSRYAMLALWFARNWRRVRSFDVLHCHLTFGLVATVLARWMRRIHGGKRPVIVETFHFVGMPLPRWKLALFARLAKGIDALALVAEDSIWSRFKSRNPDNLVAVIPNGIVIGQERPTQFESSSYRDNIEIPKGCRCIVGTLGRLVAERKPECLVGIFEEVARALGQEVHFVMGGAGPKLEQLKVLANEVGLNGQIQFPGLVVQSDLLFSVCTLYVSVNVGPITGIAGLEAAAFGIPVIALQARDDYLGGASDWIWSSKDPRAVGAEAVRLLQSPAECRKIAARQRQFVIEHCSAQAMRAQYEALYTAALRRLGTDGA